MPPVRGAPVALRSISCWIRALMCDSGAEGIEGCRDVLWSGESSALISCWAFWRADSVSGESTSGLDSD